MTEFKQISESDSNILNLAKAFNKEPTGANLSKLLPLITKNNTRGAVNREGIFTCCCLPVNLACMVRGWKDVCLEFKEYVTVSEELLKKYGINILVVEGFHNTADNIKGVHRTEYILYRQSGYKEAKELQAHLNAVYNVAKTQEVLVELLKDSELIGKCLGYPQDDIDFFMGRAKKSEEPDASPEKEGE
jgi:hypothetical protein